VVLAVLEAFAVIAVIIAVGAVVGRAGVLGDNARTVLNRVAFHVGVPALMLLSLADSTPSQMFSLPLLVLAICAFVMFFGYFVIATVLRHQGRGDATIGAWAASWANSGNLGIPLSAYVLGSTTDVSMLIVFQTVALVPLGIAIINSEDHETRSLRGQVKEFITNPIIAASVIGMVLAITGLTLPRAIHEPLDLLADLAIPTVLLAFGISLATQSGGPGKDNRLDLTMAVIFKLIAMPALAYAIARWGFGATTEQIAVVTVLAALPTAQNLNTYAAVFQRGETLARDTTLITTVVSVPVIALIALALGL
jgi:malonate transporter and related proteins